MPLPSIARGCSEPWGTGTCMDCISCIPVRAKPATGIVEWNSCSLSARLAESASLQGSGELCLRTVEWPAAPPLAWACCTHMCMHHTSTCYTQVKVMIRGTPLLAGVFYVIFLDCSRLLLMEPAGRKTAETKGQLWSLFCFLISLYTPVWGL